jgi:beta-lactamase regulating signal transducer with metallopeptidase domain
MNELFLKIVNMTISASWLILAVLILRLVLKKAPKWVNVLLWGIVAVRLLCPFSIESALSLIPSAETIPVGIDMETIPAIDTGIDAINSVVNPIISQSNTPTVGASANPLQITIATYANIWGLGVVAFFAYTTTSYWRLRRKVNTAVLLKDNIFQSEHVGSPFVLGIIKPKIYLPFQIDGQDLEHVIAHEQAHIRRRDHWWKPLGFLLLTLHWFNPLLWLAYVLLCRDIELACDEKVIKALGKDQRADYTQSLLACSIHRRMIAACPLAFGEVGVKERVKSVMNYKKPAFWIIVVAIIACAVVAVCFLTNPTASREIAMKGHNVSDLDPQQIVSTIAKLENLDDSSLLCVHAGNFSVSLTSDFDWATSGTVSFFFKKKQQTYSAQLRMFLEENRFSVTNREVWVEQDRTFKLQSYLEALKFLPKEQIRQMTPHAGRYVVNLLDYGAPGSYDRVITYTADGVGGIDGWYIHLELQPLYETNGSYNGTGKESIHLFYGVKAGNPSVTEPGGSQNPGSSDEPTNVVKPTLTLAELQDLVRRKGENLTWSDFSDYYYEDIGSGQHILRYTINADYYLLIGGSNMEVPPMYIRLVSVANSDNHIDVRYKSMDDFLKNESNSGGEATEEAKEAPYTIRISRPDLPIFDGPGYDYAYVGTVQAAGTYTIVEEKLDYEGFLWGKLKSGIGWIHIAEAKSEAPNHIPITVEFAEEPLLQSGNYHEFIADNSEYMTKLAFRSGEVLRNVRFSLLQFDGSANGTLEELYALPELTPEKPLVTGVVFYGDMTTYVISFTDGSGKECSFAVYMSARNGALTLEEYRP